MRIAQVAPLAEAVPPMLYGGTERCVSWLTEALIEAGHQVTLFASGDSVTAAELVAGSSQGLRLGGVRDLTAQHSTMLRQVRHREAEFDIIHLHIDLLASKLFHGLEGKCVTTLHGRLDLPLTQPFCGVVTPMPLISVSNNQRLPMPAGVNWLATVYHGLPPQVCPYNEAGGDYLAFLGRISPEKRPDRAIEIALRSGVPLKIAAKVDPIDQAYFEREIVPLLDNPLIEFIGEIDEHEKSGFLGNALALLFPIDWPEPFGLVMIEAMSTGTPVIAWRNGSVPEIIGDGISGVIVDSISEAVDAVREVKQLSRRAVAAYGRSRFTAKRMADNYVQAYQHLLDHREPVAADVTKPMLALEQRESRPIALGTPVVVM
ncbi:GDP-mannose-dependent alpha-(1-2)-phosphatidylinositol mannosyltransferase [Hartmannibacter diazotrophicus]|uniref:GDP-mannose-dependent alpha-(1-2)-phosphatidylinositol mannosyltransferase n=1 Tax=Hartmannibacter diazotrophicus TaxID=1482074 RepID=A0A2C9D2Q1_9HYPH|nr:glycosyltransferase family 4 protein [Hartmannibacter diazotrophicus]SON54546.1 GDP-mannose-dependent alpha-(1-2)-phosphatidylinositol mannosyltransferase [Hartmannibacter diazotrophicus]